MAKVLAKKITGMNRWAKFGLITVFTLVTSILVLKPLITNSALNQMYYFALDSAAVNVGFDGSTNTAFSTNGSGKYSLGKTVYTTSTSYAAATAASTKTTVATLYSPAYAAPQTLANPKINIAARGRNNTNITWYADVYDYDPTTGGGHQADRLLWTTTGTDTYGSNTTTNRVLTWTSTASQSISAGHRLKVVISASSSNVQSRVYFYSSGTLYSYFKVDETAIGVNVDNGATIANQNVQASSNGNVVDSFTLTSNNGTMTVTGITVTGSATTTGTNVKNVKIYRDNGSTIGALDTTGTPDTLIGSGTLTGTSATISVNEPVGITAQNYLVVYDVADAPTTGATLTGLISGLTVTSGYMANNTNTASATLTVVPTTTVTNGASEPGNTVLPSGGAATNIDAFGLRTNSGTDNITTVSATLYPAGITTYISAVDIVDSSTGTVYPASQQGQTDTWRASTTAPQQLTAGTTEKPMYVRITPKNNVTGTLTVTALVTAVSHSQAANGLVLADNNSATITLDGQPPSNPTTFNATTGGSLVGGDINLSWSAAGDASGLSATQAYTVVRGDVNSPAPDSCSTGTLVYQGPLQAYNNTGLQTGQPYSYRVCATDVVGNTSSGTTAMAVSTVETICNKQPLVVLTPATQVVAQGKSAQYKYTVINTDQGQCGSTNFTMSIFGAENSSSFNTPSVISPTVLTLAANNGAASGTITVSAKTNIPQGDFDSFMLRVTSTNQTVDTLVRTVVNDYGPLLHSSLTLGTRYGNWGEKNTCATCHTKGATPNIKKLMSNISTSTGRKQVVFQMLSTTPGTLSGVFGNDSRTGDGSTNVCEVCHHQTRYHQYSTSKIAKRDHHPAADCMQCHPHKTGFKFSGTPQCTDCHGYPPKTIADLAAPQTLALGINPTNPGRHGKHDSMGMVCTVCHSNANHFPDYGAGPNNRIHMGFSINGSTFPGFAGALTGGAFTGTNSLASYDSWSTAVGTSLTRLPNVTACSVYCHGWSGSNGNNTSPNWTGSNETLCGACHGASTTAPPLSGSHAKHAGATVVLQNLSTVKGLGRPCTTCHGAFANYTSGRHINGNVYWNLAQVSAGAMYRGQNSGSTGAPAPTAGGFGSCGNIYCHSNVQGSTNLALGTGGPSYYGSPQWGTKVTCGDCHVNMYNSPSATGGHKQHAQDVNTSFDCRLCHSTGGDANPANHANGSIDLVFDPNGIGKGTVYTLGTAVPTGVGYGACSNSYCHGRSTKTWGPSSALTLCEKCHGSAASAGGFYSTLGPGSTTDMNDLTVGSVIGKHNAHVNYSSSHRYTSAIDCSGCHLKPTGPYSAGHIDTPLPAEVAFANGATYQNARLNGYTTVTPGYTYTPNKNCSNVYCHGGGLASNAGRGNYSNVVADGGTLGSPAVPTWNANMFDNSWTDTTKPPSNCQKCHMSPPPAPKTSYTHYGVKPTECCGCHPGVNATGDGFDEASYHIDGVVKGGCTLCHANPPTTVAGLASPAINDLSSGVAGAHTTHYVNPNIGSDCTVCHNNRTIKMPSHTLDIGFNGYGGKFTSGTFWAYSSMTNTVAVSTGGGTIVRRTNNASVKNTCSVYCHGDGTGTLPPIGGGSNTTPSWEITDGSQVACGSCHGVSTTSAPTGGSHAKHALTANNGVGLLCDSCHEHQENNYHVSGNVKWHLNSTDTRIGTSAAYKGYSSGSTGALARSLPYGSCTNVYCHGAQSPVWGTPGPLACNACHGAKANDATWSGRHSTHVADSTKLPSSYSNISGNVSSATTYRFTCSSCHNPAVATHRNGAYSAVAAAQVYFGYSGNRRGTYSYAGTTYGADNGFNWTNGTNCTTTYCHSNGKGGAPVNASFSWTSNAGTLDCGGCHNKAGDAAPVWSSPHTKHINLYSANANLNCNACHALTATNNTSIGNKFYHVNKVKDLSFNSFANSAATYPNTATGCSNTYCHSDGTNPNSPTHTAILWSGTKNCRSCHGGDAASSAPIATNKHRSHMNNYTTLGRGNNFKCAECHAKTVGFTNNTSIVNRAYHVNKFKDYSGGKAGSYNTTQQVCSNNYCHSSGQATPVFRNMTGSKTWGGNAKFGCNACHGYGSGQFSSFGAPNYYSAAGTENSHKKHVFDTNMTDTTGCAKCHRTTVDSKVANKLRDYSSAHLNKVRNVSFTKLANYTGHYTTGTKTCGNTYCHNSGTPQWGGASLTCTACHNAGSSLPGRHSTHWATGDVPSKYLNYSGNVSQVTPSNAYRFECNACHNGTHANGPTAQAGANGDSAEIFFNFTTASKGGKYLWSTTTYTDSNFVWSNGRCSNTYCHSNGQATPGLANYTSIRWNTAAGTFNGLSTGLCTACHGGNASTFKIMSSNRHRKHMNNAAVLGTNFSCVECHAKTVSNDTTIGNKRNHMNKFREYSGAKAYKTNYTLGTSTDCTTATYCHTNGKKGVANQTSTGVVWSQTAVWATKCNNCHGVIPGNTTGAPDYTSVGVGQPTSNSHGKHVTSSSDCVKCHRYTTTNGTSIVAAGTHLNKNIDVNFSTLPFATVSGSYNAVVGQKNCSATYCHGSGASPSWGTTNLACNTCHSAKANDATWSGRHSTHYADTTLPSKYMNYSGNVSSTTVYRFTCSTCHSPAAGATHAGGAANASGSAQVFFSYSGNRRGTYAYQTTQGSTDNGFTWTNGNNCSTTYCHSNGQGGAPLVTSFTWASPTSTLNCTGCHDGKRTNGLTSTKLSGRHNVHMNYSSNTTLGLLNGFNCRDCHAKTVTNTSNTAIADKSKHVNKFVDFSSVRGGGSAKYDTINKNCNGIYCHSNGNRRNSSVTVFVNMTGVKTWTALGTLGCNGCHGRSNTLYGAPDYTSGGAASTTANSHSTHITGLGITDTTGCAKCHAKTVNAATANKFKDYTAASYHLNGTRDVRFNVAGTYNSGAMSCSVTSCHGASAPVWGVSNPGYDTCTYCHGTLTATVTAANRYVIAPPKNTAGASGTATGTGQVSNDPKVGAHQSHLRPDVLSQFTNYSTVDFRCQNCHGPLPTSAPHANGSAAPAFQDMATNRGAMSPTFNSANRTCSNTYCHNPAGTGGKLNTANVGFAIQPSWSSAKYFPDATHKTQNNCNRCHKVPGDTGFTSTQDHTGITMATDCSGCHGHNGDLTGNAGQRHMDGIKYGGGDCNACHDYDTVGATYSAGVWTGGTWGVGKTAKDGIGEGYGAHAKHINYIKSRLGISIALSPANQTFGTGNPASICGTCHTNTAANHTTGGSTTGRLINFGDSVYKMGGTSGISIIFSGTTVTNPLYKGTPGTLAATVPKTCINISCHYFESPSW